ncbi:MAG: CBS domain-containing protein [Bdellovibrionota bacterium]
MSFFWYSAGSREARPVTTGHLSDSAQSGIARKNPYQPPVAPPAKRKPAFLASQIMTRPVATLTPESSFAEARDVFRNRRYRHIPIVSASGELVGIISDRDVLREAAQQKAMPQGWLNELVAEQKTVGEFMTRRVLAATPQSEIRNIARAMFEERIGSMPVVDEHGKVLGIITRSDILRTLVNNTPLELWI